MIEQLLRDAVAQGVKGVTLWPSENGWQASVTFDKTSWRVCIDADPVEAMCQALTGEEPPAAEPDLGDLLA